MNTEKALFWYMVALAIFSLIAWQIILIKGQFLGMSYPYDTFLYHQPAHFGDFTGYDKGFVKFITSGEFTLGNTFSYFPVAAYGYIFFYYISSTVAVYVYLLSVFLAVCISGITLGYILRRSSLAKMFWIIIVLTILTSYPFMFLIDRGNIEGLLWIFVLLGTLSFVNNKFFMAGACFAIAASMKLYPVVFLLLLLSKHKYKEFVTSIFILVIISILAAYGLTGSICETFSLIFGGQSGFLRTNAPVQEYIAVIGFIHSLYSVFIQTLFITQFAVNKLMVLIIYIASIPMGFILIYLLKIRYLPLINQVFALAISSILLPFVSVDYTLVHLYIPWGLFMIFLAYDAESAGFTTKQALNILIPCAIIFTPQSYLIIEGVGGIGGQVKALTLLYLLIVVLKSPMPSDTLFKENYSKL